MDDPAHISFLDHPLPLAIAHRGGAGEAEENTMPAFERAVRLGFGCVETDIQVSRDGVAVLFHDDTLDRLTGTSGRVGDHDWARLSQLRTAGGAGLARLDTLLHSFPRLRVILEPKCDAAVAAIARNVARHAALPRICVGSFQSRRTRGLRRALGPDLCWSPGRAGVARLWLAGWGVPTGRPAFALVQVPPHYRGLAVVTPRFVRAAHARGIRVQVWTVDAPEEMDRLLDMGVDALMSDHPRRLRDVLRRRGQWAVS